MHKPRAASNALDLDKLPAVFAQLVVEVLNQQQRFIAIRTNHRMYDLAQETKERVGWTVEQIESAILEDPIVGPIVVIDAMLPDVASGVLKAAVLRRQRAKVEQALEELHIGQAAEPRHSVELQAIDDVLAGFARDVS